MPVLTNQIVKTLSFCKKTQGNSPDSGGMCVCMEFIPKHQTASADLWHADKLKSLSKPTPHMV